MNLKRAPKYWPISLVLIAMVVLILISPRAVELTEQCEPRGVINRTRAVWNEKGFWSAQTQAIDEELRSYTEIPSVLQQGDSIARASDRLLDSILLRYAPKQTAAERAAQALRRKASEIEHAETNRHILEQGAKRTRVLTKCREIAQQWVHRPRNP